MILTNEDYDGLRQIQFILSRIIKNAVMSELEEEKELKFEKLCTRFNNLEIDNNYGGEAYAPPLIEQDKTGLLKFTEKELLQMPKKIRIVIRELGYAVYARKRTTGRYKCSYEIRFKRNGYDISASGTTKEEAKKRFIEKVKLSEEQKNCAIPSIPSNFDEFAMYWFNNFHKRKVIAQTYKNNLALYNRHIKAKFEKFSLRDIPPAMLQDFLEGLPGNGKTADDAHGILNQIFDTAVLHGKLKINPLNLFIHTPHETETGVEFTRDEELKLLSTYNNSVYGIIFAVMLYTGLRPNEYKTAVIDGDFLIAVNSKRKTKKVEYKKIPICTLLRSRLGELTELPKRHEQGMRQHLRKVFPTHTLKDLRKTFNTRCVECKVDFYAKEKFMGHTVSKLERTYTGSLDDYLLTESKKLSNWYSLYPKNTPNEND